MPTELIELLQGGGNIALITCVYFIYKAAHRLSRVEIMLELLIKHIYPHANIPPEENGK